MRKVIIGSVSSGTTRPEDLIPAFYQTLRYVRGAVTARIQKDWRIWQSDNMTPEVHAAAEEFLMEALFDALQEVAPPYMYFGAHPGDGADYGFWLSESWQQDAQENGELFVSDLSELEGQGYTGYVFIVNDHGNVTLYSANRGKLSEVWSIV
jgi:hypothetical protein